jgi:hypothetical protein
MTDIDPWAPRSRPTRRLTPEQQTLAEEISLRAHALWVAGEMSIEESVDLALVQLGYREET